MSRRVGVLLLLASSLLGPACARADNDPYRAPLGAFPIDDGRELYQRDCAWCHGDSGEGTAYGPAITSEGTASVHFTLTTGRMPLPHPEAEMERGPVAYSAAEIDAIVEFSSTLTEGEEVPEVDPRAASFAEGAELYLENCASCHSSTGTGSILSSGIIVPDLFESTPTETAEAMLVGPSTMPVFDSFDEDQIDSIVKYVIALQESPNRGGHPLGKLGPFSEGAVAWLVGLGLMIGVIRWIGTKAAE